MKILVTGTTGYIGKRILPILLEEGHSLVCCVRDTRRSPVEYKAHPSISFLEIDFLTPELEFPADIDVAYYLIHSMSTSSTNFTTLEERCAINFKTLIEKTKCKQVIYLSGIVNDSSLSTHLKSRLQVEKTLHSSLYALTTFRAGVIVGSGSASFEIIRDLVEKLPIMVAPRWLLTKSQPIAVRDVLTYLVKAIENTPTYNKSFDIVGPEILSYKDMLLQFAEVRNLRRVVLTMPVLTPKLSSYWLYFVTSTSFNLAKSLVDSMKIEIIGKPNDINKYIPLKPISYKNAVKLAFKKIAQNSIISSWKDAQVSGVFDKKYSNYIDLPHFGCFKDIRSRRVHNEKKTLDKIWSLGGLNGWYAYNFLWKTRGVIDQLLGGVGLRRGRRDQKQLNSGDALDFWRVLLADKKEKRVLLFAEMKIPGEAWLEFEIINNTLFQRAVFRPKGLFGRIYWYLVLPFHGIVFRGLINYLAKD